MPTRKLVEKESTTITSSRVLKFTQKSAGSSCAAFTLVELIVVLMIMSAVFVIAFQRSDTVLFWKQQSAVRQLHETIKFVHHQAVADQNFYRLEFDFTRNAYRTGVMAPDSNSHEELLALAEDAGNLTLELAYFMNPSLGETHYMIAPPEYPSLYEWKELLPEMSFEDVRTTRGLKVAKEGGSAYIHFSPRGFSEFAVIHLRLLNDAPLTILVNPFTGLTQTYKEYKDFEWTYGRKKPS